MPARSSLFSDPVHGFVRVPKGLLLSLVDSPEVQRLRRIRQLGLGFLVFPGAVHTRFEHGLGAMALMHDALDGLREAGTVMATDEVEGALAAALLHDVGHGPFSHTLEHELVPAGARPFHHEAMSRALMARLDRRLGGTGEADGGGPLAVALAIFDGAYGRPFFRDLVASQLDMDRLDYLRRDSFYTGVAEGVVGVDRILKTLRVHPRAGGPTSRIVVEAKGAYAVENFLLSRRLMYGQVYLHKTVLAADHVLRGAFARARALFARGEAERCAALGATAPPLAAFLGGALTADALDPGHSFHDALLDAFTELDDTDVLYSLKRWTACQDPALADLARRFVDRDLFATRRLDAPPSPETLAAWKDAAQAWVADAGLATRGEAEAVAELYLATGETRVGAYSASARPITFLEPDGALRTLPALSDAPALAYLEDRVARPFVVAPKGLSLAGAP